MKKFLAIAVIAATLVACNEGEKKVDEVKTSDTTTVVTPAAPTTPDTALVVKDSVVKTTVTTDTIKK